MKRAKTPLKTKVSLKGQQKNTHKLSNWKKYNKALEKRGCVTVWIDKKVIKAWKYNGARRPGGKVLYSDLAIQTCLVLRVAFHLALRQTEGFVKNIKKLMKLTIPVPDYTTLSKRSKKLKLIAAQKGKQITDIVVDSTGVKVYGEGEWKVRTHGYSKRRTWRKLHLLVNPDTHEIISEELTTNAVTDSRAADQMLKKLKRKPKSFIADKGYDKVHLRKTLYHYGIRQVIDPREGAVKDKKEREFLIERDNSLDTIKTKGKKTWKKESNYHRRSLAEVAMFRYKMICGDKFHARCLENQETEAKIGCLILNHFLKLGMPESYRIETT